MYRKAKKIICVLIAAFAIEMVCFQSANIWKLCNKEYVANQVVSLSEFEPVNWETGPDGYLVSMFDPMLYLNCDNIFIDSISIKADTSNELTYVDFFYINEQYVKYGDFFLRCEDIEDNSLTIEVHDIVQALRIDLGDMPSLSLYDLTVTINPVSISPSLSRIVAMILIYWCGVFLFSLQKMPDYGLYKIYHSEPISNDNK